ncbi:flagellar hook-associated protein FlgK [Kineococcus sp. SYSU DK004]|uniref:flagellar hook-associated protein FlgK n=1 Tax=Kineococcus sp. SYSU DK004 TaxID=3383125 RepID=UPI003D7CC40F
MSTFSGINQASRALTAAQRAMEVTGQNIANANTPGYSRQRVDQVSSVVADTGQWARQNVPGDGVQITGISRVADALAAATARQDSATAAEQKTTAGVWTGIEGALGDTGGTGLSKDLADLSAAWNDLANAQGSQAADAAKALVLSRSQTVASTLNSMDSQLSAQFDGLVGQGQAVVDQANEAARRVADLNAVILRASSSGSIPNELLDQRDGYVNQLADLTGARVVQREHGVVDVYVGNGAIVSRDSVEPLRLDAPGGFSLEGAKNGQRMTFTIAGTVVEPPAGQLKATLDGVNKTLREQSDRLDQLAGDIVAAGNRGQNPAPLEVKPGATTAAGVRVVPAYDFRALVASDSGSVNGAVAAQVQKDLAAVTGTWRVFANDIASSTQSADNRATLAQQVSLKSSAAREAVSGVSIDEEMTNLVSYQHAYSAAARVLTAIDEALDRLINRTGVVGR